MLLSCICRLTINGDDDDEDDDDDDSSCPKFATIPSTTEA